MYDSSHDPWFVGFSGGKDSTAVIVLLIRMLLKHPTPARPVTVVYCDTGVEIPYVTKFTKDTIRHLQRLCSSANLPIRFRIASPKLSDRYFVKVIGRGYAPPTNKFRWCTDRLRIRPVEMLMNEFDKSASMVVLGVRSGESLERDRILSKHLIEDFVLQQAGTGRKIFAPILDFDVKDVWGLVVGAEDILEDRASKLLEIYRDATNECPTIRDLASPPCGQGRFGCWTCTVVRKDKAVTNMVERGKTNLAPLLKFRNWLLEIRDHEDFRANRRRNGQKGKGPFTLRARRLILKKLIAAERESGLKLISKSEVDAIKVLWCEDLKQRRFL